MQHPDVEHPGDRRRIVAGEVGRHVLVGEALAVDGDAQRVQGVGVWPVGVEQRHVRHPERAGHAVLCIVIAAHHKHLPPRVGKPSHLVGEKKAGAVVRPIPVIDVAGDHEKRGVFRDRKVNQTPERAPSRAPDQLGGRSWIGFEPAQRTVEMDVGGMNELELAMPS